MRKEQIEKARQDSILHEKQLALQRDENRAFQISVEIYDLLDKNKTRAAKSRFNKEKAFLSKFLTKDAYEILEITIENPEQFGTESNVAYIVEKKEEMPPPAPQTASSDENLRKNQERAQSEIIQIYEMLEKNNIKEAMDRFQKNRTPLQKYLDKEVFEMLEMTVTQANIQQ